MALVSDIQLQSSAVKPPNLDTSQKFSAEGLTATTAFSVTDAGAGTTVTPLGLMTAQSANDISAYFNTTNTDGDINLYLNNDANPYWNLKLSGTASDSFMITNACGGPAGGTAAEKTALSITPVGAVGIGKASASNALDISYQNSSSGGVVITEATNSIATKIISESSSGSIGTTTNSKFGFRTNSATVGAFDTSGNFGIGTDAPGALLDVRGAAIFNEAGAAVDFRIEGDTCANLFFVDGSADKIGIGTATPQVLLDVDNGGATSQILMCVNGCICAAGYLGEAAGHTIEDAGVAETQRTGLNFVVTDVGCVVDDETNDATVVCINGANTCVPFLMCDGSTSDPISLAGGSIGNQVANDGSPCLGGTLNGCDENVCCICCLAIKGCYFGDGSQLTGVSSVPSSFSGDCTIIGCSAGGNVAAGGAKIVLIGGNAGYNATTPSNIVVMGSSAGLCMTTATDTVLIGTGSGRCVLTCAGNLALGAWSLYNECAGTNNTVVGTCAGHAQKGATTNTFVGSHAGVAASTGSGNVFIGYRAGCACTTQSNRLYIGNAVPILVGDITCGLVGIGTTSVVTHAADTSVLQIGGNAVLWGNKTVGSSKSLQISQNAQYDEDGSWEYISTDQASNYYQDSGTHAFRYAASGTAGADITWSTALTISNAGLVGIGTGAPATLLDVTGTGNTVKIGKAGTAALWAATHNTCNTLNIGVEDTDGGDIAVGSTGGAGIISSADSGKFLQFATAGTVRTTIDETGKVGIGTTSPSGALEVIVTPGVPVRITDPSASTTASEPSLGFYGSTDGATRLGYIGKGSTANNEFRIVNSQNDAMYFGTNDTERMRITSAGYVGIGTTAPDVQLHVEAGTDTTTGTVPSARFERTGASQTGVVLRSNSIDGLILRADSAGFGSISSYEDLGFYTGATPGSSYGTVRMRIDSATGNIGINTATACALFHVMQTTAGTYAARFENNQEDGPTVFINHTGTSTATNPVLAVAGAGNDVLQVKSNGAFFLSRTNTGSGASDPGWLMSGAGGTLYGAAGSAVLYVSMSATGTIQGFRYNDTYVGQVSISTSATSYESASDYRLKENIVDLINATDRVAQLKPRRFNWKVDPDVITDGFIAHEVDSIVPEAVSGTKDERCIVENVILAADGTKIEKNVSEALWQDGKTDGKYPIDSTWKASHEVDWYQSMDNAKLVPVLTAAVQELTVRLEAAETKITILEAA